MLKRIFLILSLVLLFGFGVVNAITSPFYDEDVYKGLWLGTSQRSNGSSQFTNGDINGNNSTKGLESNINNEIGVKTKLFYGSATPSGSMVYAGTDINADGSEDVLYGYGGKLYLSDLESGNLIWETKVLGISKIVSVENLLGDGYEKQIIVQAGSAPYFMGVIDGLTGEMISSSVLYHDDFTISSLEGGTTTPVIYRKDEEVDILFSGGSTFNFAMRLSVDDGEIKFEPLYNDYAVFPSWGGGKRPNSMPFGEINGKEYMVANDRYRYGVFDLEATQSATGYIIQPDLYLNRYQTNYSSSGRNFFYDFNGDGNDEFIVRTYGYIYSGTSPQDGYVILGGTDSDGGLTQYWGRTADTTLDDTSVNATADVKVAKNYSDLSQSVLYVKNATTSLREGYIYSGSGSSDYSTGAYTTGNNYNLKLDNTYDGSNGSIAGIFDNGDKDLVILSNSSGYNFYKYEGADTFSTGSTAVISGSYVSYASEFDTNHKKVNGYYYGVDSDNNGRNEFIVAESGYFKFYEISENVVSGDLETELIKKIPYSSAESGYSILKRGLTYDLKNLYSIGYKSGEIYVFISDLDSIDTDGTVPFSLVGESFYAGGSTSAIKIGRVGGNNYVSLQNNNLYDFSEATPTTTPTIVKSGFPYSGYFFDVDPSLGDGIDFIYGGNTYSVGADYSLTLKRSSYGLDGDFDGDGILDRVEKRRQYVDGVAQGAEIRTVSGYDGSEIATRTTIGGCGNHGRIDYKFMDVDGDGKDDIIAGGLRCYAGGVYKGDTIEKITSYTGHRNHILYDIDLDGKLETVSRNGNFSQYYIIARDVNESGTGTIETKWEAPLIPRLQRPGDVDRSHFSVNTDDYGVDIIFETLNGRIVGIDATDGSIKFDEYLYDGETYSNMSGSTIESGTKGYYQVFEDGGVPANLAGAYVADMDGDGENDILAGSNDGWVYILDIDTGEVKNSYEVGSSIIRIVHGDVDNDGVLDVLISSQDGYVYQLTNSDLAEPIWVKDGLNYGYDISTQTDNKVVNVNFASVTKATGYFVQLYNQTEKSVVFDWIDIGSKLKACIVSSDETDDDCIDAGKTFSLNGKSIYVWRVQSYNDNVTSSIATSDGFSVLNLDIDKQVALKENLEFVDELTVSPNTILTYKITVTNDSLNTVGGSGYMNYDLDPAQSVSSCDGVDDCRSKNLVISDYMPTDFTYIPNSTVWIVKKTNTDGSETVISGGSQVSDSYFTKQDDTNLTSDQGATLIWQFPTTVYVPPSAVLELQFDAIARSS